MLESTVINHVMPAASKLASSALVKTLDASLEAAGMTWLMTSFNPQQAGER